MLRPLLGDDAGRVVRFGLNHRRVIPGRCRPRDHVEEPVGGNAMLPLPLCPIGSNAHYCGAAGPYFLPAW
jgi:hypothetical protein